MPAKRREVPAANQRSESNRDLQALLGPAPLLEGEDSTAYDELRDRIQSAVAPKDAIDEIWVRDIVDLLWETMRLRRLKAKLMQSAAYEGLEELLRILVDETSLYSSVSHGLTIRWARRDPDAVNQVADLLKQAGLNQESIAAQTLAVKLDTFSQIDRMIMQTESRRNAILREVDRRREALAQRLREATATIEDAEFTEICPARQDAAE
jgi:hypothetical protein